MIRVHLPADHNYTTATFRRSLMEAFPCDAQGAVAMHCVSRPGTGWVLSLLAWLAAIAAVGLLAWLQVMP